ncbi:tetraspanin-2-like [Entelurus aequoreus]|uniref:tetraspanin-2-like n=1 Tax=Entelurus aequoreus TaxID=161455 RepID=UPI002B1DD5BF|nr:tetraspanin-2-like [Entelurus aequoreus]
MASRDRMSNVHGGMTCVKYLLLALTAIFWLSGLLVLAVGLWLRFDPDTVQLLTGEEAPHTFFMGAYMMLGATVLMMLGALLGSVGAVRESQSLLTSFLVCLLIIFAAEITAGVFGFINKEQIVEEVQKYYSTSIRDNTSNISVIYHTTLSCCGGSSSSSSSVLCAHAPQETKDCLRAITDFFSHKMLLMVYMGTAVGGVMILGMIFSMVLCCAIRHSREVI